MSAQIPSNALPEDPTFLVDRAQALSRVGGDEELLREIAEIFRDDYPRSLAELRSAVARADAPTVERVAHGLKGAISNFASQSGVAAALRLEILGNTRDLAQAPAALETLEIALQAMSAQLDQF
jgi:two-component system sensor histidine kinase/response regulator